MNAETKLSDRWEDIQLAPTAQVERRVIPINQETINLAEIETRTFELDNREDRSSFWHWCENGTDGHDVSRARIYPGDELRDLNPNSPTAGGFLTAAASPGDIVEFVQRQTNPLQRLGTIVSDEAYPGDLLLPLVDDTETGALIPGNEIVDLASSTAIQLGQTFVARRVFSSKIVEASQKLVRTSLGLRMIMEVLGRRLATIQGYLMTVGSGAAMPMGIVPAARTVAATNSNGILLEDINNLPFSVTPDYRFRGFYMCHSDVAKTLVNAVDGMGKPKFKIELGQRPMLNDYPLAFNDWMDSTFAAGKKTLLFGAIDRYIIRQGEIEIIRYNEKYIENGCIGFQAQQYADGTLLNHTATTLNPVSVLLHS